MLSIIVLPWAVLLIVGLYWARKLRTRMVSMVARNLREETLRTRLRLFTKLINLEWTFVIIYTMFWLSRQVVPQAKYIKECDFFTWYWWKMPEKLFEFFMMATLCWTMVARTGARKGAVGKRRGTTQSTSLMRSLCNTCGSCRAPCVSRVPRCCRRVGDRMSLRRGGYNNEPRVFQQTEDPLLIALRKKVRRGNKERRTKRRAVEP